jgi:hypothetical protein
MEQCGDFQIRGNKNGQARTQKQKKSDWSVGLGRGAFKQGPELDIETTGSRKVGSEAQRLDGSLAVDRNRGDLIRGGVSEWGGLLSVGWAGCIWGAAVGEQPL